MPTHNNGKNKSVRNILGNENFQPFFKFYIQLGPQGGCTFFIQKRRKKRVKCLFLYLKLSTTLQVGTSIIESDMWVKQGKRLYKFLQKYTDYGTETSQLAGYNIAVLNMENISAGLPLLSIGAIKNQIFYILARMLLCMVEVPTCNVLFSLR